MAVLGRQTSLLSCRQTNKHIANKTKGAQIYSKQWSLYCYLAHDNGNCLSGVSVSGPLDESRRYLAVFLRVVADCESIG